MGKELNNERSIITIVGSYYPLETGFSLAFQNLERAITENQCIDKVYVIAPMGSDDPRINKVEYSRMPHIRWKLIKGLACLGTPRKVLSFLLNIQFSRVAKTIENIAKRSDVKIIFVESMFMAWAVPLIRKSFDIPVVVRIHGTGPEETKYYNDTIDVKKNKRFNKALLEWTFESKYVAATTSYYFDFFRDYWNDLDHFIGKNLFIIPNTASFPYVPRKQKDKLTLIQLGRMDKHGYHQKGFTDTLQALYYLEETLPKATLSKIRYISIGGGGCEDEFVRMLSELKTIESVHYSHLSNQQVKENLYESDIVVMPSRIEGMSMFATEALATGKAFISTRNNGLRDLVVNGYNGIVIDAYDYLGLAQSIETYIANDNLINEFSKHSRELFEKEFTYEAVAKKFNIMLRTIEGTF